MDESLEVVLRKLNVRIRYRDPAAFEEITGLAEQYPEEPKVWRLLAYAHEKRDDYAAAIAAYTRAIALSPKVLWLMALFFSRGESALYTGDYELAVADFSQGLVLSDEFNSDYLREELHFLRAEAFIQLGKKAEALADLSHVKDDYVSVRAESRSKADLLVMCGEEPPVKSRSESREPEEPEEPDGVPEDPDEEEAALAAKLGEAGLEAVDAALLKYTRDRYLKAARVIADALDACGFPRDDNHVALFVRRLIALAEAETIEAQGNLYRPTRSEVGLPEKP